MLKFINYQLDTEERQQLLETQISPLIQQRWTKNLKAINAYDPNLSLLIQQNNSSKHSIFCTKTAQLNMVNINTGRVLYQEAPEQEMVQEVQAFIQNALFVGIQPEKGKGNSEPLPANTNAVMMFGFGLGYHIIELLKVSSIRYLVIYEPNLENLACSIYSIDWQQLFELANSKGTQLSFQFGNAGTTIASDIQELTTLTPDLDKIYLYRHLCHPVSDDVFAFLLQNTGDLAALAFSGRQFLGFNTSTDYVSPHANNVLGYEDEKRQLSNSMIARYEQNMRTFLRLYPEVHKLFINYSPSDWHLVQNSNGDSNLWHQKRRVYFYNNLHQESTVLIEQYLAQPFKDDVIVGLASSDKFKSFVHYQYIEKLQQIFLNLKNEQHPLPEQVDSLIVFGVALGKHIEKLVNKVDIKNLYICEPNLDFFYASLFVTDWDAIFSSIDKENKRIYLNIGGDGTEYFSDFMAQFYQVGAFAIANTYMFSSYYTPELLNAVQSLKRQLKVVLTMGEYYDHARYGIAHTYISLETEHKFMKKDRTITDTLVARNIPVFIIGNGPSLDQSIEYIKEHRARVIVVSCGTTIRSLYQLGIQPDFHAEVEQNRATYDWITQVNDPAYLKGIKIISVNGLHPDTASLFAQSYLAFKSGEASTQLFQTALAEQGFKVDSLTYAYPTVSNMALSYVLKMGFKTIYLFGVDLGYTDIAQHHSKHSAYYTASGAEVYDYKALHGNAMTVKGNFRHWVYTKPEFDVSRQVLEQVIATVEPDVEIYNCSDGAMIKGAVTLAPDNILLSHQITDIDQALAHYLSELYFSQSLSQFAKPILDFYDLTLLRHSIRKWQQLVAKPISTVLEAKQSINKQWEFIKQESADKHNLLFYLFFGSTNYFLSVLTKVLPKSQQHKQDFIRFNQVRQCWHDYLADALDDFVSQPIKADKATVNYLPKTGS
jgi:hypothetical protein